MELAAAMKVMEKAGTEQYRKTYRRHGAKDPMFGVSWSVLRDLAKKIGRDAGLSAELWATGNHDARVLACLTADAAAIDAKVAEARLADIGDYTLCGQHAGVVSRSPVGRATSDAWRTSKEEWRSSAGWVIVAALASHAKDIEDAWWKARLDEIQRGLSRAPNRTRHEMNLALIAIGARSPALEKAAIAAAKAIGKVEVDHGQTGCITPDAIGYLKKVKAHKAKARRG